MGNGPAPTRVVYDLAMPRHSFIAVGPTPAPAQKPPVMGCELVTNGYVPLSRSNSVPCAPSNITRLFALIASYSTVPVSHAYLLRRFAYSQYSV